MTTRRCNTCMLYYPDMIWSHTVSNCPFCGASIKDSGRFEYLTFEEKQAYREINEGKEKIEKNVVKTTTKQQEKLYELSEFLQHYLSANDYDKVMSILNEILVYLKSDVMDYIEKQMLKDLDEEGKKLFMGLIRLGGRKS